MTGLELFAFVVLPVSLVALGVLAFYLNKWDLARHRHRNHPAE